MEQDESRSEKDHLREVKQEHRLKQYWKEYYTGIAWWWDRGFKFKGIPLDEVKRQAEEYYRFQGFSEQEIQQTIDKFCPKDEQC